MNFCPGQNSQSIEASNFKLQTSHTDRSHSGQVQCTKTVTLFHLFLELLPFINFNFGFLSGHTFQSIEASRFKQIDHIKVKCSVQES